MRRATRRAGIGVVVRAADGARRRLRPRAGRGRRPRARPMSPRRPGGRRARRRARRRRAGGSRRSARAGRRLARTCAGSGDGARAQAVDALRRARSKAIAASSASARRRRPAQQRGAGRDRRPGPRAPPAASTSAPTAAADEQPGALADGLGVGAQRGRRRAATAQHRPPRRASATVDRRAVARARQGELGGAAAQLVLQQPREPGAALAPGVHAPGLLDCRGEVVHRRRG